MHYVFTVYEVQDDNAIHPLDVELTVHLVPLNI
jgi:hypothetical protein